MTTRSLSSTSPSSNEAFTHPTDFIECLRELVAARPDDTALTVVAERNDHWIETVLSYREFAQRVHAVAATLQRLFAAGERILILLDNDEHYAVSMFACFHAGVIAVPVFPPESARPQHMARLAAIAVDALASGILTLSALKPMVATAAGQLGVSTVIAVDDIDRAAADTWRPHRPAPEDVAFLQYTSGSTSAPKGVMVTHANLMANERAIREGLAIGDDDIFGVWSPLFHDMGLIGGLLQPFYSGIPCVLSSPRFFLERPVRWLQLIARHHVTISGGPDFAYRLCLDRITDAQIDDIDLSSWRIAYTGAEPVRHDTMDAFSKRFASAGFAAGAVYPCYGLAEATLYVTGGQRSEGMIVSRFDDTALANREASVNDEGAALVGCGSAPSGHHVRIANPDTGDESAKGAIGEIWAAGPSIAAGYWNKPAATAETFVERDGHRWLRTGDLGFVHDGHLYVAGRLKDMIIVRGHNLYPHDIERVIEANVEAVRKGRVAAFAVTIDRVEGIGVAAEVSRGLQKLVPPQALVDAISAVVSEQCGDAPAVVVLLNPGALPKTSSGKLQRSACKKGWEKQALDAYAVFEGGRCVMGEGATAAVAINAAPTATAATPNDDIALKLSEVWRDLLGHDDSFRYASDAHFLALGGNSLAAVQLAARVSQHWHIAFTVSQVFEFPRLDAQAAAIRAQVQIGGVAPSESIPVLSAERRAQPLPLSSAQQRQWFLWQVDPQGTAYHVQGALRVTGALDADALRFAIDMLARRHESFRTTFRMRADGELEQLIAPDGGLDLQQFDLRAVSNDQRESRCAALLQDFLETPFDLTQGPLARAALLRLQDDVHVLALGMHHIISDGASMQTVLDEMADLYAARRAGQDTPARPALQYADYAVWEREGLGRANLEQQLAYWKNQLNPGAGEPQPVLTLPSDHPRESLPRYRAGQHVIELPQHLLSGLRARAQTQETTFFVVMLSAFQALLHRYTGQTDIRVGVPTSNRNPALQSVVGFFVNTLVLRNRIDLLTPLDTVLDQAKTAAVQAHAHQDVPFEKLVEALQPERSLLHTPLVQVLFNHQVEDHRKLALAQGGTIQAEPLAPGDAQFELSIELRERQDGSVAVTVLYADALFDPSTMERFASHYQAMLNTVAHHPDTLVTDVELLGEDERHELANWSRGDALPASIHTVHQLFEAQVARTPDATALIFDDVSFTYTELNERANRLAHQLIQRQVAAGTLVGIAMERSTELVVTMLAVMKTGAAYVPIDPDYPEERITYLLNDSKVKLLLTQPHLRPHLPRVVAAELLNIDDANLQTGLDINPDIAQHPDAIIYVIYTSGSTGKPKGAANRHQSLCNRLAWGQQHQPLGPDDAVLQKTPYSFDISFWEFCWPLTTGARLVVAGPAEHRDPRRLVELINQHRVTTIHFVPSMLQAFIARGDFEGCESLRRVICSGEALPTTLQQATFDALPQVSLLNLYGPTEAAIEVTYWDCQRDDDRAVPIGRPIAGLRTHILDSAFNEVPRGVVGELFLGGLALAQGYWHRPGLTAERFVADPLGNAGECLYRTGDLVRWRIDGQIDYLGRVDHQVKVRGFRIELGEVEGQLCKVPEVREAVVVANEGPHGTKLVAYVSLHEAGSVDGINVREDVALALPDYMVPSLVVVLDSLPLNANGKVDRKALPPPDQVKAPAYEAPVERIEAAIAMLWGEVLGIGQIGIHDNFFDLGGHSLQLIRVHKMIEERLRKRFSVIELFKHPTVYALAQRIERGETEFVMAPVAKKQNPFDKRRRAALLQRQRKNRTTQ